MKDKYIPFTEADRALLYKIERQLSDLLNILTPNLSGEHSTDWISEPEAQKLLKRKTTTLWKMRNEGKIRYTKVNNKTILYSLSSIMNWLQGNSQDAFDQVDSNYIS